MKRSIIMFENLVESTKQKTTRRTGGVLAITSIVYAFALTLMCVGTIITFSPVLAEEYSLMIPVLAPPLTRKTEEPQLQKQILKAQPESRFLTPKEDVDIPPASELRSKVERIVDNPMGIGGLPPGLGNEKGVPGSKGIDDYVPPPPAPKPTPKPDPTPSPAPERQNVSEGVLQGIAIQKVKPIYPQTARTARSAGQVQITISEEGRVIESSILSGPALLRSAALEAARKWVFSPTKLSNVPVKVQGVLTFNFIFE